MNIRYAEMKDIAAIAAVEAECFPPAEAATEKDFVERVRYYGKHFWLMHDGEKLIAFVDGFVTDEPDLTDEMYENAAMHNENGAWQMIFGVNTLPEYRRHGYAGTLLRRTIDDAKQRGRIGVTMRHSRSTMTAMGSTDSAASTIFSLIAVLFISS